MIWVCAIVLYHVQKLFEFKRFSTVLEQPVFMTAYVSDRPVALALGGVSEFVFIGVTEVGSVVSVGAPVI